MKPNAEVMRVIEKFIQENPDAKEAFYALRERGTTRQEAKVEIARVFVACLWEADKGLPMNGRLETALKSLREGKTAEELFPDDLYEQGSGQSH